MESRKKVKRCKSCQQDGHPYIVGEEKNGVPYFYLYCEECLDDITFFDSEKEAHENYLAKYNKIAE